MPRAANTEPINVSSSRRRVTRLRISRETLTKSIMGKSLLFAFDAPASCRGVSRSFLQQGGANHRLGCPRLVRGRLTFDVYRRLPVETNVKLPGTRPGHRGECRPRCRNERDTPRHKARASSRMP